MGGVGGGVEERGCVKPENKRKKGRGVRGYEDDPPKEGDKMRRNRKRQAEKRRG